MATSLNNQIPARDGGFQTIQYLRKALSPTPAVDQVVGKLPANAVVLSGAAAITTVFNGTTPTVDVGWSVDSAAAADANGYATALSVAATGVVPFVITAAENKVANVERTVVAKLTGAGMSSGAGDIIVAYSTPNY